MQGRSGSGKSTLLRLLLGLERPDDGRVKLDGIDLASLGRAGLAGLRRRDGGVRRAGRPAFDTLDVAGNLDLARALRDLDPRPGLTGELAGSLGIAHLIGRPVRLLSSGERQRVAVARALVVDARLVVCDEPTSQVDEAGAAQVAAALLASARGGAAVVVATHDPLVSALADRIRPQPWGFTP